MPDAITPVATQIQVPNGISTVSGILGLKQQQQALQTGQYQQAAVQAESQQAQQKNAELQKVGALMQNVHNGGYRKSDGTLDRQRFADDVSTVAPVYGQGQASSLLSQANEIVSNQKAKQDLTDSARGSLGTMLTTLAKDPNTRRDDVLNGYTQWMQDHKDDPAAFRVGLAQAALLPQNDGDPKFRETLGKYAATLTGQPTTAPSTVDTGAQAIPGTTSGITGQFTPAQGNLPRTSQGGIPRQVGPGANLVTDSFGHQFLLDPQTNTVRPVGTGGAAGGGTLSAAPAPPGVPARPPTGGFQQPVAGQQQVLEGIENARTVGDQTPGVRNVNSQLLKLSQETATGPGTQTAQKVAAFLGMPSGSSYQEINAYLDRQAAMQARAMGVPNTNAGLAAAQSASGTTEYTPKALQEKVKFADALNSGAMAYRQGLDKAVGTGPTPDLTKYQAFRSAWAQNFDPDVFRAEDAIRRGDKDELGALRKRLGADGMKVLAQKSANLRKLEGGQIP